MRVEVYKNLHKNLMSVREVGGRVLTHERTVLIRSPEFVVGAKGRERVLREQRKNVHAYVRGDLAGFSLVNTQMKGFDQEGLRPVTYNPYKAGYFYDKDTGAPVRFASLAVVSIQGVWYRPKED